MSTVNYNALWVICVLAVIIVFSLAIRRRRLASRESARPEPYVHQVYSRPLESVLIHRESTSAAYPSTSVYTQPPSTANNNGTTNNNGRPPAFDPVQQPPPSYQDHQKDTRIQPTDQQ